MPITDPTPQLVDLSDFTEHLRRRGWIVALGLVVGAMAMFAYSTLVGLTYTSFSTVIVHPLGVGSAELAQTNSVDIRVESELAQSYLVAERVVGLLDADVLATVQGEDPARTLRRNVAVADRGDRVLEISYTHPDPAAAQHISEVYTAAFLEVRLELSADSIATALANLDVREAELVGRLSAVTEELGRLELAAQQAVVAAALAAERGGSAPAPVADPAQQEASFEQTYLLRELAALDAQRNELQTVTSDSGEIIGPALLPDEPSNAGQLELAVAGAVSGALLAIGLVWLMSRFDRRVRTAEELLERVDVPILAHVRTHPDVVSLATAAPTPDFALLATSLVSQSSGASIVSIAGPTAGLAAGRVSVGVAKALCATHRVVVVSGDLVHDQLSVELGVDDSTGLARYLGGESFSLHRLGCGFDVLAAGRVSAPAQLARSPRLVPLLAALRQTYDVVLVAVPGFGDRAEATSLVWASDKIVLCLEPDHDTRSAVLSMVQLVRDLELGVLGAVTVGTFEGIATTPVVSSVVADPPPMLMTESAPLAMTATTVSAGALGHPAQQSETVVPSFREVSQEL